MMPPDFFIPSLEEDGEMAFANKARALLDPPKPWNFIGRDKGDGWLERASPLQLCRLCSG
jgi:hypothetical protein